MPSRPRRIWNWLLTGRTIRHPRAYWIVGCQETSDQGVVEVWITDRGRPVLTCDVCHATWFHPDEVGTTPAVFAVDATGDLPDGDSLGGAARPATRAELERLDWWRLVPPPSRERGGRH